MICERPSNAPEWWLGRSFCVRVDRPKGSTHPKHPTILYPINYGFIPNTKAADGHEIDAYILGIDTPLTTFTGPCIAIAHRLDDVEDKLIIAPKQFCAKTIMDTISFQEQYFNTTLITPGPT